MADSENVPEPPSGQLDPHRARDAPRPRVALALGSGGARGYAHIGVIHELHDRGYQIVGIAGSSMGALVGGLQAAERLDEFADWARSLTQRAILRLLDPVDHGGRCAAGRKNPGRGTRHPRRRHHRATADPLHRGGHRSVGRQVGVVAARAGRRGHPGIDCHPGSDCAARHRRAAARRRRDPRSAADGADLGGQRRSDHRGQPVRQRGHRRRTSPNPGPRPSG